MHAAHSRSQPHARVRPAAVAQAPVCSCAAEVDCEASRDALRLCWSLAQELAWQMADDAETRIQNRMDTANRLAEQLRNKDVEVHDILYRLGAEMVTSCAMMPLPGR